jgi:pimeloyl-ACP methyl ester carboxylesterase
MQPHLIAIHGIRTRITSASWPKRFLPYAEEQLDCTTEAHYYEAGPIPPWNLWVTNPKVARGLAASIEARMARGLRPVHIVAHSNGTNIAVALAKRLQKLGIRVHTLVLIGSALHADIGKSGLRDLILSGQVRRCFAYSSPDDRVIRQLQNIPGFYGSLGSRGFERWGDSYGLRVREYQPVSSIYTWPDGTHKFITRWFPEYGHGDYFEPEHESATYACILRDLGA